MSLSFSSHTRHASPLTIRRLSERTGATLRALRHYESLGLLSPLRAERGARLYSQHECMRAAQITRLRRLGLPLSLIQGILEEDCEEKRTLALLGALKARLAELESHIPLVRAALSELEWSHIASGSVACGDPGPDQSVQGLHGA